MRAAALLLATLLCSGAAQACGPLRLALLSYPGFYQRQADGSERGIDVDIAAELQQRSGCRFVFEPTNTARLWPALQSGQVELSSGAAFLPERQAEADYLWLIRGHSLVLSTKALAQRVASVSAFDADAQLRLGVIRAARRGEQAQAWVDRLREQGRLSESADMPSLIRAFEAGRVDAVLLLPGSLHGQRDEAWFARHALHDWLPQDRLTAGWVVSRRGVDEATRSRLRAAGEAMRQDGSLMRLLRKNLGDAVARQYEFLPAPAEPR